MLLLKWFVVLLMKELLICATLDPPLLKLGMHKPSLGSIKILNFEPTPEDFYRDFIRSSVPALIRTKNPSWHTQFSSWTQPDFLETHLKEIPGRAYNRPIWTEDFPAEVRLNFSDFLKRTYKEKLYWDSTFPVSNTLFQHVPLPLPLSHYDFTKWVSSSVLLYASRTSTSVFHHDGAENLFFQISGKKTWLLANYSIGHKAYADSYTVQSGLSPINPEEVDLKKYPLAADIEFYNITTEPGDMLYVPEHWWHHVTSFNSPIISVNFWANIVRYVLSDNLQNYAENTILAHSKAKTPLTTNCKWQHIPLSNVKKSSWEDIYAPTEPPFNFQLYFGSDIVGCFYAVSSWNGKMMWNYTIGKDTGSTPAVSADERSVFFAGENSVLYAFDAESGKLHWNETLSDIVVASLRLSADKRVLYVASMNGWVYAFNVSKSKKLIWKQGPLIGKIWSSPYVNSRGIILFLDEVKDTNDPSVIMLDAHNGRVLWKNILRKSVRSSPAVDLDKNILYVMDTDNYLNAIDLNSGKLLWIYELQKGNTLLNSTQSSLIMNASPVITPDGKRLYVTTGSGTVLCMDLERRSILWQLPHNDSFRVTPMSSPLLYTRFSVIYAAVGRHLFAVNESNGVVLWKFKAWGEFMSSPRIDIYENLYIGSTDSVLYAFDGLTGKLNWYFKTGGPIVSSVTIPTRYVEKQSYGSLMQ